LSTQRGINSLSRLGPFYIDIHMKIILTLSWVNVTMSYYWECFSGLGLRPFPRSNLGLNASLAPFPAFRIRLLFDLELKLSSSQERLAVAIGPEKTLPQSFIHSFFPGKPVYTTQSIILRRSLSQERILASSLFPAYFLTVEFSPAFPMEFILALRDLRPRPRKKSYF